MVKAVYRLIMEKHLGRELTKDEVVHHIDGDSHNNDISNLLVVTQEEHSIIHAGEKIDWSQCLNKLQEEYKSMTVNDFSIALGQFFTKRQQQLIFRKLVKNDLSKTEREYFSRTIKKKLKAIAHPEVQNLAKTFIQMI